MSGEERRLPTFIPIEVDHSKQNKKHSVQKPVCRGGNATGRSVSDTTLQYQVETYITGLIDNVLTKMNDGQSPTSISDNGDVFRSPLIAASGKSSEELFYTPRSNDENDECSSPVDNRAKSPIEQDQFQSDDGQEDEDTFQFLLKGIPLQEDQPSPLKPVLSAVLLAEMDAKFDSLFNLDESSGTITSDYDGEIGDGDCSVLIEYTDTPLEECIIQGGEFFYRLPKNESEPIYEGNESTNARDSYALDNDKGAANNNSTFNNDTLDNHQGATNKTDEEKGKGLIPSSEDTANNQKTTTQNTADDYKFVIDNHQDTEMNISEENGDGLPSSEDAENKTATEDNGIENEDISDITENDQDEENCCVMENSKETGYSGATGCNTITHKETSSDDYPLTAEMEDTFNALLYMAEKDESQLKFVPDLVSDISTDTNEHVIPSDLDTMKELLLLIDVTKDTKEDVPLRAGLSDLEDVPGTEVHRSPKTPDATKAALRGEAEGATGGFASSDDDDTKEFVIIDHIDANDLIQYQEFQERFTLDSEIVHTSDVKPVILEMLNKEGTEPSEETNTNVIKPKRNRASAFFHRAASALRSWKSKSWSPKDREQRTEIPHIEVITTSLEGGPVHLMKTTPIGEQVAVDEKPPLVEAHSDSEIVLEADTGVRKKRSSRRNILWFGQTGSLPRKMPQ